MKSLVRVMLAMALLSGCGSTDGPSKTQFDQLVKRVGALEKKIRVIDSKGSKKPAAKGKAPAKAKSSKGKAGAKAKNGKKPPANGAKAKTGSKTPSGTAESKAKSGTSEP